MVIDTFTPLLSMLHERRELIVELVRRELRDRHSGQSLGALWAFGHPLLLMGMYTLLFAYVFPARYTSEGGSIRDYSASVLAGIVPWLAFQDLLSRAPSILVAHANLVKQIVFPIEVLPLKTTLASAIPYSVGLAFTVVYSVWHGSGSWWLLTLPWLAFWQLVAMAGVAFLLSAGGVFVRDLREFVQILCTLNLFAQPILYNPFVTPHWLQLVFAVNPFSYLTWCWQDALYHGAPLHSLAWWIFPLTSLAVLLLGWAAFQFSRGWFGDAL